jgi:predicted nuclease of predicted toxin-antitoxin system
VKILLDHNIDWRLKRHLPDHEVRSTKEMRWERLTNGQLLSQAEGQFDVLLTVDRNIKHQQNLVGRQIAIVVLVAVNNTLAALTPLMPEVEALLPGIEAGHLYEVALAVTPPLIPKAHEQTPEPERDRD